MQRFPFALQCISAAVALACAGATSANPTGPSVAAGNASFETVGRTLNVTNAPGTIINWNGFSIGAGETTRFIQQSASSAVLNRVVGNDPSSIFGTLSSNGRVFLVNPHGIVFGAGARIDTAGFIASTLNITDANFLNNRLSFEGGGFGVVRNEGTIRASGDIMLVGPRIENAGLIRSDNGSVLLAAGQKLTITSPDAQGVRFEVQAPADSALNVGALEARNAVAMFAGTLKHSGDIRAGVASADDSGRVILLAKTDTVVDGNATITASGTTGGNVQLLGDRVGVFDRASVDASGERGGGTILVGGDYQGRNPDVANATQAVVAANTTLRADALTSGDGGKVIVWSDGTTRFGGTISARGGDQSGNGGFVETSGKESLSVIGAHVDTSAPNGRIGTWLLDPHNVILAGGGAAVPSTFSDNPGTDATIDPSSSINGSAADVVIQANNDITFDAPVAMSGLGRTFTAQAGRSILVNQNISTNNGNITLSANEPTAGAGTVVAANRDVGEAAITMAAGTTINTNGGNAFIRINDGAGRPVPQSASGDITLANITANNVSVQHVGPTANGKILSAAGNPLLNGAASVFLLHTPNGEAGSIGLPTAPIRAQTLAIEALTTGASGGIFLDSPNTGLQIGGVPNTIYGGTLRGVQTPAGGPISITVNGDLTRFNGGVLGTCFGAGGSGPICANNANVTLSAAAIGGPGDGNRIQVNSGSGIVSATTTAGGIFVRRLGTNLDMSRHTLAPAPNQPIELYSDALLSFDRSLNIPGSAVSLFPQSGGTSIAFTGDTLNAGVTNIDVASLTITPGALAGPVQINSGLTNFNTPVTLNGSFSMQSGASANFNAASTVSRTFELAAGTLGGIGTLALNGPANIWSGGTIGNTGGITASSMTITGAPELAGRLTLAGAGPHVMTSGNLTVASGATLAIAGTATGNLVLQNGVTVANSGLIDFQSDADIAHTAGAVPTVNNLIDGIVRKSGGAGTSTIGLGAVAFLNGGRVEVQAGSLATTPGSFDLNAGVIEINEGRTFATGGAPLINSGSGTIGGNGTLDLGGATLTNNGLVRPGVSGTGTLTIDGNVTIGSTGAVNVGIAGLAASQIGRVAITGDLNFQGGSAGTLSVTHQDGFTPPSDTPFTLMTFAGGTGDFASKGPPGVPANYVSATRNAGNYTIQSAILTNEWFGGTGSWDDPNSWSLGHAPTATENALIPDAPTVTNTITIALAGQRARRLTSFENITVAAGDLVLGANASEINATLTVSGGSMTAGGPLTANTINVSGGALTANAGVTAAALNVSAGTLTANGVQLPRLTLTGTGQLTKSTAGDLTISGPFAVSGGEILGFAGGNLITSGTTSVTGTVDVFNNWTNTATLDLTAGRIALNAGSPVTFTNAASGTVNLSTGDATPFGTAANATINNAGIFNKSSAGAANFAQTFNNQVGGAVNVAAGALSLLGNGTQGGAFDVSSGASLVFGGAGTINELRPGYDFTGAGQVLLTDGTLDVRTGTLPRLDMSGGTLTRVGGGDVRIDGTYQPTGGTVLLAGDLITGGTTNVGGVVSVDVTNWRNLTGGVLNVNSGRLEPVVATGVRFSNGGVVNVTTDDVSPLGTAATAVFTNASGGIFNMSSPSASFPGTFTNAANATLNVNTGTLTLPALGDPATLPIRTQAGTIRINSLATLSTGGNSLTNVAGGTIAGAGTVAVGASGTLTNAGRLQPGGTTTAGGTGTLFVTGSLVHAAGGTLDIELGGTAPGVFDALSVTGDATLAGGGLNLSNISGYTPANGDTFNILSVGGVRTGAFPPITKTFANEIFPAYTPNTASIGIGSLTGNTWLVDLSGAWDGAGNWSQQRAPNLTDNVVIDRAAGLFTITVPAGVTANAGSLFSNEDITVIGTLGLGVPGAPAASTVNGTLSVPGGRVQGPGALTVNGALSLNGATIASTGGVTVNGTTTSSTGVSNITGTLSTTGLSVPSGTLNVGGTLNLSGAGAKTIDGGTLTNAGTTTLSDTNLVLNNAATLTNSGTFNLAGDVSVRNLAGTATFANTGTLAKTAGAGTSTVEAGAATFVNSGTITAATGTLDFSGANTFDNGTVFDGAGITTVTGNSTFNDQITSSNLTLAGGDFSGNATFNGTTAWTGGRMLGTFTVPSTATLNVTGSAAHTLSGAAAVLSTAGATGLTDATVTVDGGARWQNTGTVTLAGNAIVVLGAAAGTTFANNAGGTVNDSSTAAVPIVASAAVSAASFTNAGTFTKTVDAAAAQSIDVAFSNSNTVNVNAGTLTLLRDGTDSGIYNVPSGTTLAIGGGTRQLDPGITLNGTGALLLTGGTLDVRTASLPRLNMTGGTLTKPAGGLSIDGAFTANGGTLTLPGGLTTAGTTSIGGAVAANMPTWTNAGTLNFDAGGAISPGAAFTYVNSSRTNINAGAALRPFGDAADAVISNSGVLSKNAAGTVEIMGALNDAAVATVVVDGGTLKLLGGGTHSGTLVPAGGSTLEFGGGTNTIAAGAVLGGTGNYVLSGGTLDVLSGSLPRLNMSGGTLTRATAGPLTVLGAFNVSGGTVSDAGGIFTTAGTTTVTAGAALTSAWNNTGTLNLTGGEINLAGAGAAFTNSGEMNLSTPDVTPFGDGAGAAIANSAVMNIGGATAFAYDFKNAFANNAAGSVNLNAGTLTLPLATTNAGIMRLAGGTTVFTLGTNLTNAAGATFSGAGAVNVGAGTFINSGTLDAGLTVGSAVPGALGITGNFTQTGTGVLNVRLAGVGAFDALNVTGTATLGGTLNVTTLAGFAAPVGSTFNVLTHGPRVGDFAAITYPATPFITSALLPGIYQLAVTSPPVIPTTTTSLTETSTSLLLSIRDTESTLVVTDPQQAENLRRTVGACS